MAALTQVRSGPNFTVYRNGDTEEELIKIDNVRFSYPHFGEMYEQENETGGKEASWGGVAMLSKTTHVQAKTEFMKILTALLARHGKDGKPAVVAPENRCIKNGDDKEDENMHGHWLITFKEKDARRRPSVRNQQNGVMTDAAEIDEKFYGGCFGSVLLRPWYFGGTTKNKPGKVYPKRLCCGFTGVQFARDGEAFGQGRINDDDAWGAAPAGGGDGLDDDDI